MDFSVEETKALAKLERDMDSGAMPYVMFNWSRMAVTPDIMEELGLEQGQTINQAIMMSIMQAALAACQAKIAMRDLENSNPKPSTT